MSDPSEPGPAFTLVQLATLAAWSAGRPRGFRHVLAQAYEQQDEVAEMTQREAHDHLYRIYPTVDGRVCLEMTHGGDAWEMGTIEEALTGLLVLEEELEIEWAAFARQPTIA
jgi:CYTH domain-containing protein